MLNLLEALAGYVSVPTWVIIALLFVFLIMQVIGEVMEFCGKVAPGFMKIRKSMREKREKELARDEMVAKCEAALSKNNELFTDFFTLYSNDNMRKRKDWVDCVNDDRNDYHEHREENRRQFAELREELTKNSEITLAIFIENKRSAIIAFAARVADPDALVTHEQFRRIFKIYEEYEDIIDKHGLTNGEVDISIRIIREAYEERLKRHAFVEDIRGYNG